VNKQEYPGNYGAISSSISLDRCTDDRYTPLCRRIRGVPRQGAFFLLFFSNYYFELSTTLELYSSQKTV
jgi:hypothetical protein